MLFLLLFAGLIFGGLCNLHGADTEVTIHPQPFSGALRNPLMGFVGPMNGKHPYATLSFQYIKWNAIENAASDGVDKLRDYTDTTWLGVEDRNIKIIPRVFLEWPQGSGMKSYWPIYSYWPADLPRDYASPQFKERVKRMIAKMGEAWDLDPRIAFVETGIIGAWGEQHHPDPTLEIQKVMGDAFTKAFKHKMVMNRYPWQFTNYQFGIYWDSFGNPGWEMRQHVPAFEGRLADRWKIAPMGGEMSFSTDTNIVVPRMASNPTDAVATHADTLIQYIRRWHWTGLAWVSQYDQSNAAARAGAARVEEVFGYRYAIDEVRYPASVKSGGSFSVSFEVRNLGSAPMYYNWPVEVSLLDATTREPVWKSTFPKVDIRKWLPGDFSDKGKGRPIGDKEHYGFEWDTGQNYDIPPKVFKVNGKFKLPSDLPKGRYILALAILDPAGNLPSIKFATRNYFKGGRSPIGNIGIGVGNPQPDLDASTFDDPNADRSLHYTLDKALAAGAQ